MYAPIMGFILDLKIMDWWSSMMKEVGVLE